MVTHVSRILAPVSSGARGALFRLTLRSFETSVTVYQSIWRYIPDDSNLQQHLCESLRSTMFNIVITKVMALEIRSIWIPQFLK
jgi:hypothetical protein